MSKPYESKLNINPCKFNSLVKKLREFFDSKGFIEVHTQNRLSILAACEDPFNIRSFYFSDEKWPLPQTGQMWLEYEMLKNPNVPGYFCMSTSYRDEPNPVEGRHDKIFPLFEFELKGTMEDLINLEIELLVFLGYDKSRFRRGKYEDVAKEYGVIELEHEHEMDLYKGEMIPNGTFTKGTPVFFLTDFPEHTSPFWNMKRNGNLANKVDVILSGMETFGSAERETDTNIMLDTFNTISEGKYKGKIFEEFGEERTMSEMDDYLKLNFFERAGGGIGLTRLIKSMILEGLL